MADTAAEHPTERRFMQIRIIKAEERIPSRQMRVAATAEISLEKMICHRFPMLLASGDYNHYESGENRQN